jgi:hypothetical protein
MKIGREDLFLELKGTGSGFVTQSTDYVLKKIIRNFRLILPAKADKRTVLQ